MKFSTVLMLSAAISVDAAAAGTALGSSGIRLPKISAFVISVAGALFLLMTAAFGDIISNIIPEEICRIISKALLFAIGCAAIAGYIGELRRNSPGEASADKNNDRTLSVGEAAVLAVSLSMDAAVTGLSAGLTGTTAVSAAMLFICALVAGYAAVTGGWHLGKRSLTGKLRIGWLSGAVLIALAFLL